MSFKHERVYDVILLGATGYTGKLAAEHIAKNLPTTLKWAVAGRSAMKLEALINQLRTIDSDRTQPGRLISQICHTTCVHCRWNLPL